MTDTKVVTKSLAGGEDLLHGVDPVQQNRAGQLVTVNQLNIAISVSSEAIMSTVDPAKFTVVDVIKKKSYTSYVYSATDVSGVASTFGGSWLLRDNSNSEPSYYNRLYSFADGSTLNKPLDALYNAANDKFYVWQGALPKVVPPGSTPASTGGIGAGAWRDVGSISIRRDLLAVGGASMVNTPTGTVQERLDAYDNSISNLNKNYVTNIIPCPTPSMGGGAKAIFKKADSALDFFVVTKKARNQAGYVAMRFTNEVSPADAANYGGASPLRLGSVYNCPRALYAKLVPSTKSAGVTLSTLTAPQIETLYGYNIDPAGGTLSAFTAAGDFNMAARQVYNVPNTDSLIYALSAKRAKVRLGYSNGSSAAVTISISRNGVDWSVVKTINTALGPSGSFPLPVDTVIDALDTNGATWYLKVANTSANPAYVVGLNFEDLGKSEIYDYDNTVATLLPYTGGETPNYFESLGANEFAAKELSTGKFFGTYHGGHSGFQQRLRVDAGSYNLDSGTAPTLFITKYALLHSISTLAPTVSASYTYYATTEIGDGSTITNYSLKLASGTPIVCERVYTHMAVTANNFNWVHLPFVIANKTDDSNVSLGQTGTIQQFRAHDAVTINCTFSQVNTIENAVGGASISFQPAYNKQYYGPVLSSVTGQAITDGVYTTCKEFF